MIKSSYKLTTVTGIPVRMHITLIILLIFAAFQYSVWGILYTIGLFTSVALHELGHSWVAIHKGCRVQEILLLPIGGVAKISNLPSKPADEFQIAIAGPLTSFALAGLFMLLGGTGFLMMLFYSLAGINLMLALFNLLPSFPMDGGRIFRAFMTPRIGRLRATALAARIGRIMAVAFGIFGLLNWNLILLLISIFIYQAAGAEYRAVYAQHMSGEWFTLEPQADIHVGPPPYARKAAPLWKKWKRRTDDLFNDLFKARE